MARDLNEHIGFVSTPDGHAPTDARMLEYVNLKLAARGLPICGSPNDYPNLQLSRSLLAHFSEKERALSHFLCPVDQHVNNFLNAYLHDVNDSDAPWLPTETLELERHGLARLLSIPPDRDWYKSELIQSYRVQQGICHNPRNDRRTTKGVFHVCEGGFAVPADKKEVPKITFARLLRHALNPPKELLQLPFTDNQENKAKTFISLLLRPTLCPEVPGYTPQKSLETRFFAPGSLAANLDFVESIFGNAGDPFLPENDARLDIDHWSGHTGCVILAPHLVHLTKKELGLPKIDTASERQKRDGMCWSDADERYNDGGAFKITCRDHRGVIVTVIADNYFGYCKKEVKTQISYAANLHGQCEEEHAGGALTFPSYDLGEDFIVSNRHPRPHTFDDVVTRYGAAMDLQPEGYGIDKTFPDIHYVPEDAFIDLRKQTVTWGGDTPKQIRLLPQVTYVVPSGFKVEMIKPSKGHRWRLVGTRAEGTFCHKPCTVSGGGKSEISKPISDIMVAGPIIVHDFKTDFDQVDAIIAHDYGKRFIEPFDPDKPSRPLLSPQRSLGSVVKLLTPSPEYTDDYNDWVNAIPRHVRDLVLLIKRFYKPHWEDNWRHRFSVDNINGEPGNVLKYWNLPLNTMYLRIGFDREGAWRTYTLRKDFWAAHKLQREDDITASISVPAQCISDMASNVAESATTIKFATNCEYRLFQRPDEAIVRGHDKQAEADFGKSGNFFSNYEPLSREEAQAIIADAIQFDMFTPPMRKLITEFVADDKSSFVVSTSHPRLVNGIPTKNPRYLQNRPDLGNERDDYLAQMGARMYRRAPLNATVPFPVDAVLPGRRNNPPDYEAGIRPLAVYNPIHYQELPELFMDFVASLTGKSPSTTGAGSEGALTKGPFNAMPAIIDLNNALVSFILCGHHGFTSAAGYVGPNYRVDHDISLLVPELWCRLFPHEREPEYLIANRLLERVSDFEHKGKTVLASRLGYRITKRFCRVFLGRMFSSPDAVFNKDMLKPERQGIDAFADGVNNIVETQQKVAMAYFDDGTVDLACPPLKALLHIMAHGQFEGHDANAPVIRQMFSKDALLSSDWYQERLCTRRQVELQHVENQATYLSTLLANNDGCRDEHELADIAKKLDVVKKRTLALKSAPIDELIGTIGADPAVLR